MLDLAVRAVEKAINQAGLTPTDIGAETAVLYVQNGITHFTPPSSVLLCHRLNLRRAKPISLDGVCAESLTALELGCALLAMRRCTRLIIAGAANFLPVVRDADLDTTGLFGAGAGAVVIEASSDESKGLYALQMESDLNYWDLGIVPLESLQRTEQGLDLKVGYYRMRGSELAKIALKTFPGVVKRVLSEADWRLNEIDRFVPHQPNAKLLAMGARALRISYDRIETPVSECGNLGAASVFVALSLAMEAGRLHAGDRLLLLSFGLGFTCGAAAVRL